MKEKDSQNANTKNTSRKECAGSVGGDERLGPMDFSTFVMSMASSAMVNLGRISPPEGEHIEPDLNAARQVIDILGMLENKTKGNLDDSEEKLLSSLLYDLRLQFVNATKKY